MKSTVFKLIYEEDDATYPSLADMSRKSSREHRLNFIAVNHDVGSTVFAIQEIFIWLSSILFSAQFHTSNSEHANGKCGLVQI